MTPTGEWVLLYRVVLRQRSPRRNAAAGRPSRSFRQQAPVRMSVSRSSWLDRISCVAGLLLVVCTVLSTAPAHGQYWRQTARIVTPVENGSLRALLDTLAHTAEVGNHRVERTPASSSRTSLTSLQTRLIAKHGIGIRTANAVLVRYEFQINTGNRVERVVQSLQFQLRYPVTHPYIRVLHLDAQQPWVQRLLNKTGTPPPENEAGLIPFRHHLQFSRLMRRQRTRLVEIGGTVVRGQFAAKKEALARKIERLTYGGPPGGTGALLNQDEPQTGGEKSTAAVQKAPTSTE